METYYKAINWNAIEDVIDKSTWEKLTEQFWLDTRIPLSNDLDDWRKLSHKEKDLVGKVFGGLTLLDTLQSESGVRTSVQPTKKLSSTTFNSWSPFTPSLTLLSFLRLTPSQKSMKSLLGPIQTHTCKRKLKLSMRYT